MPALTDWLELYFSGLYTYLDTHFASSPVLYHLYAD